MVLSYTYEGGLSRRKFSRCKFETDLTRIRAQTQTQAEPLHQLSRWLPTRLYFLNTEPNAL